MKINENKKGKWLARFYFGVDLIKKIASCLFEIWKLVQLQVYVVVYAMLFLETKDYPMRDKYLGWETKQFCKSMYPKVIYDNLAWIPFSKRHFFWENSDFAHKQYLLSTFINKMQIFCKLQTALLVCELTSISVTHVSRDLDSSDRYIFI